MLTVLVTFDVELHSSVSATLPGASPPKTIPDVEVPAPPSEYLELLKSATSVQITPFHSSFLAVTPLGSSPPTHKAEVLLDPFVLPDPILAVFKSPT